MKDNRISENFSMSEFLSPDSPTIPYLEEHRVRLLVIAFLQPLRDRVGPIIITSGYRTPERNKEVGGAPTSWHMTGAAADFKVPAGGPTLDEIYIGERDWPGGLRLYEFHIHVDARNWDERPPHRWRYDS